jgi:hypothetical protein
VVEPPSFQIFGLALTSQTSPVFIGVDLAIAALAGAQGFHRSPQRDAGLEGLDSG